MSILNNIDYKNFVTEQAGQSAEVTYENYKKIKSFEDVGYLLQDYVISGGEVTKDLFRNDIIVVTDIVVSLNGDVMRRDGSSFSVSVPNTAYFLDFTADGDWHFGTAHAAGTVNEDYLAIAEVTTISAGLVKVISDMRGHVGGFRLKDEYGLEDYAKKAVIDAQLAEKAKQSDLNTTNAIVASKASQVALDVEITNRMNAVSSEKAERLAEIAVERNRINGFTSLAQGSTTGDAELFDARIGADGVTYANAGAAIRGQVGRLKSGLGKYDLQEITMINGYNINLGVGVGNAVTLSPEAVSTYRYVIVDCVEGDLFTINGTGGSNPRLWGFVDSNNILLSVAVAGANVSNDLLLVTPKNASKLIVNDAKSGRKSYVGSDLTKITRTDRNRISALEVNSSKVDNYLYGKAITMTNDYYIALGVGVGNTVNTTPTSLNTYRYAIVDCSENDMFIINGTGGSNPRLWGFIDSNNVLLSVSDTVKTEQNLLLIAPKKASKLIINDLKTGGINYDGVNLEKTLANVATDAKKNESYFQIKLEETYAEIENLGAELDSVSVRATRSKSVSAKELTNGTGTPTFNSYGVARVPYWSMSGEISGQSVAAYVGSLGDGWDGVEISAVIMAPSGTPLETDFDVFQAKLNPLIYGQNVDSYSILTNPVAHKSISEGIIDRILLDSFVDVDTSKPFTLLVYRKKDDKKDTNPNPVGIVSVDIKPVVLQKFEIQQADKYNAWPFISDVGDKLVVVYSKGLNHEDNVTPDIYRKISLDGGYSWSPEKRIVNSVGVRDTITGKGKDSNGNMLLWVRKGPPGNTATHHLYRTNDGETFTSISSPSFTETPTHIGDIFNVPSVGLMAFYNSAATHSWGVIKSVDNGITWTQQPIESSLPREECPTEISGAYIDDGKIIAIGRKEYKVAGKPYAQYQIQSSDYGETWSKIHTNIADIAMSTPSLVHDTASGLLNLYYFHRGAGKLRHRKVAASDIWDNPLSWPNSKVIAMGTTNTQDTGNVNAAAFGDKHIAVYYSGDETNTSIYAAIISQ